MAPFKILLTPFSLPDGGKLAASKGHSRGSMLRCGLCTLHCTIYIIGKKNALLRAFTYFFAGRPLGKGAYSIEMHKTTNSVSHFSLQGIKMNKTNALILYLY